MKEIRPMIDVAAHDFLAEVFGSSRQGAHYILTAWPALYKRALHNLRGTFTRSELMLLVDVFNATALTPGLAGQHIMAQVEDGIDLDHLDEKWGVRRDEITAKLRLLDLFSLACLEIWANSFWYGAREGRDIEEYVARLATPAKE